MDAQDRLQAARNLAQEGRHEEALQEYIWFFEHVLEEQPEFAAVRLSFALGDWMELAEVYPKARLALEDIRDRKADVLRLGAGRWDTFHDLVAINERLGCEQQTYELFQALAASNPKFAERCGRIALPSMLAAGDYELAERFLPDPVEDVTIGARHLNRTIEQRKQWEDSGVPRLEVAIDIYAADVKRFLAVLEGRGRLADAQSLRALAIQQIEATDIRDAVTAALEPDARPWYER